MPIPHRIHPEREYIDVDCAGHVDMKACRQAMKGVPSDPRHVPRYGVRVKVFGDTGKACAWLGLPEDLESFF